MIGVARAMQEAVAAALLAAQAVTDQVAMSTAGPAVFAPNQAIDNVYPRISLPVPQVLPTPDDGVCGQGSLVYVSVHCWTQGPSATLQAGDLSDAVRTALNVPLALTGRRISAHAFESANPVGDPDETVEHVVCTFRYSVRPSA